MMDLPLEAYFRKVAAAHPSDFPAGHDYVSTYFSICSTLRDRVYPAIDPALAQAESGIFTFHNKDHFDEVVIKAGELIGVKRLLAHDADDGRLLPYELFVLLLAIRIHDAGNCYGRSGHEKRCEDVLNNVHATGFPFRETELMAIAGIAQAHGGLLPGGDKDVIGVLPEAESVGNSHLRSQRIAATVRFADELAENTMRSPTLLLQNGLIPKKNEVYHQYANSLQSNAIERFAAGSKINLRFYIAASDAIKKFGKDESEVYLIDEIKKRLTKMNQERVYCNRFLPNGDKINSISAAIVIRDAASKKIVWENEYLIRDEGYPGEATLPRGLTTDLDGQIISDSLQEVKA